MKKCPKCKSKNIINKEKTTDPNNLAFYIKVDFYECANCGLGAEKIPQQKITYRYHLNPKGRWFEYTIVITNNTTQIFYESDDDDSIVISGRYFNLTKLEIEKYLAIA